jgi:hypothetical protein
LSVEDGGFTRPEPIVIGALALAAMDEARATLSETVIHAGIGVVAAMLEEPPASVRSPLPARPSSQGSRAGHTEGELPFGGRRVRVPPVRGHAAAMGTCSGGSRNHPTKEDVVL